LYAPVLYKSVLCPNYREVWLNISPFEYYLVFKRIAYTISEQMLMLRLTFS